MSSYPVQCFSDFEWSLKVTPATESLSEIRRHKATKRAREIFNYPVAVLNILLDLERNARSVIYDN